MLQVVEGNKMGAQLHCRDGDGEGREGALMSCWMDWFSKVPANISCLSFQD